MKNIYNWPLWHWHFELTSACTLKCPRCSRTELPEDLVIDSLDLKFFKEKFPAIVFSQVKRVSFCGYDGDPIYNKQFIEICQYLKSCRNDLELYIVTNGSYKKPEWWAELATVLNEHDQLHFSLDGWDQASNEKYRVNCNWDSIVAGIEQMRDNPVRLVWDMIYFDFNYEKDQEFTDMAKSMGFDAIRKTKSNKFNFFYESYKKDLEPPRDFISPTGRFESITTYLSDRPFDNSSFEIAKEIFKNYKTQDNIIPLCLIGTKGLFVDSQGYFYPCCWIINKYNRESYYNWLIPEKNLKQNSLEDVLNHSLWEDFFKQIPSTDICKLKCNKLEVTEETVTRW